MNFSERFQTVALFDTFISGSENHKSHDNFLEIFRKLLKRNSAMGFIFCYAADFTFWNSENK